MTGNDAWDGVNWDLAFESFEWMVHLAACFNRHLSENAPWTAWPDWSSDMPGFVVDEHRPGWLSALRLVHTHPRISVKGNTITVTDSLGTVRALEDVDVSSRWWHVDVWSDWNVPLDVVAALDAYHGASPSTGLFLGRWSRSVWGWRTIRSRTGLVLRQCFMMLDGVALFDRATDFHAARCRFCRETTYRQGLRGQGFEPGKEVLFACWSCTWSL